MSKPTIIGIIVTCLFAGFLIGIYMWPRMWAERAVHEAAGEAVGPAIQQSVRQVAHEAGRDAAKELADKVLAGPHEGAGGPPVPSAAPAIERTAFAITLPDGSAVDPESASLGSERLVTATLPGHGTICISVADDKERARTMFEQLLASFRGKVQNAEKVKADAFDAASVVQATGIRGSIKGEEFRYEVGQYEGWDKAFVIICEYPEENKGEAVEMMRKALGTFRMKQ